MMKRILLSAAAAIALGAASLPAQARPYFAVGVGIPLPAIVVAPAPVCTPYYPYHGCVPAAVFVAPGPVFVAHPWGWARPGWPRRYWR